MTELEKQLLSALESLQEEHEKQHREFVTAYNNLHQMFETTSRENASLSQQVNRLSGQVTSLSDQLRQLESYYSRKSR